MRPVIYDGQRAGPLKGHLTGQHFVEHYAERVNVAPRFAAFRFHLFRRDIVGRAHFASELPKGQPPHARATGYAEIEQLSAVFRVDHDVFGFQIAVDYTVAMSVFQCLTEGRRESFGRSNACRRDQTSRSCDLISFATARTRGRPRQLITSPARGIDRFLVLDDFERAGPYRTNPHP